MKTMNTIKDAIAAPYIRLNEAASFEDRISDIAKKIIGLQTTIQTLCADIKNTAQSSSNSGVKQSKDALIASLMGLHHDLVSCVNKSISIGQQAHSFSDTLTHDHYMED